MTTPISSYLHWILDDRYAALERRIARSRHDVGACFARLRQDDAVSDPATLDLSIQLVTAGSVRGTFDFGAGRFAATVRAGGFAVTPPGVPLHFDGTGPFEITCMMGRPSDLARFGDPQAIHVLSDLGPLHASMHRDAKVRDLVTWLWEEAAAGNPNGALYHDSLLVLLVHRLQQLARPIPLQSPGSVAPHLIRRLDRYVDEHLAEPLTLRTLAEVVGLSQWHFARAFKQSVGLAPVTWVTRKRIDRAQELLRTTKLSCLQVALACGYESAGAFSHAFKREVGTSPLGYRRDRNC